MLFRSLLPGGGDTGDAELTQLTEDTEDVEALLTRLAPDGSVGTVEGVRGGESVAHELLERFIEQRLAGFDELRNDPAEDYTSGLSPYLHFGQMSPLTIALAAMERADAEIEGFLEELVVRRELAFNFTWYDEHYDSFECLPRWARETLEAHEQDHLTLLVGEALEAAGEIAQLEPVILARRCRRMVKYVVDVDRRRRRPAGPILIDVQVVHDGEEIRAQVVDRGPRPQPYERPRQALLNEILGIARAAHERPRIAAHAREMRDQGTLDRIRRIAGRMVGRVVMIWIHATSPW